MNEIQKMKLAEMQQKMLAFQKTHTESFTSENGEILGIINGNMEIIAFAINQVLPMPQLEQIIKVTINNAIAKMSASVQQAIQEITKPIVQSV